MIKNEFHGSDKEAVAARYGIDEKDIISFSSNVNPLGLSEKFKDEMADAVDCITEYPERDYASLRKALSCYTGVDPSHILPGNGSTELIGAFIRCFKHPHSLIVSPAYAEYERDVRLSGGEIRRYELNEEDDFGFCADRLTDAITENTDIIIICNPVNPTSTALSNEGMRSVLKKAQECDAFVLVDETYVEFSDMKKVSSEGLVREFGNLVVLRSMSKFFSCPGLRLGYAMTKDEYLIEKINSMRDPWSVSSYAEKAAIVLLSDTEHMEESREFIAKERNRVCALLDELKGLGLKYYSPCANFILCRILKEEKSAGELFDYCIERKLMIRDCTGYGKLDGSFFRFCFMDEKNNDMLIKTIKDYLLE
ncbi:MAG: aminotransferase class I/II-fold pyridoxal phosphate-dependent enzyme [Lachnospiraceae bacterium]|nr:aminotransferase class I/II-fold pyridoxal phosphate-dependent enzyme [Lachnospiraceae bacterium]